MPRRYRALRAAALGGGPAPPAGAAAPPAGELTAVRIVAAPGRVDFVLNVRGAVEVNDFLLADPDRLVLDLVGAKLGTSQVKRYDGVSRGGITNVRYAQYKPDVVRIVLDLDAAKAYKVERHDGEIRVSFASQAAFKEWSTESGSSPRVVRAAEKAEMAEAVEAADAADADDALPRATSAPQYAGPEVGVPLERSAAMRSRQEPRITVTWDRASIADVVAGFAAFSGRTIILGKDIKGEVNAEIKNQPWPQAFQAVLATQGLTAQEMPGGIIRVDAPQVLAALDSLEPLETSVVRVNYAQAGALSKTIESILTKGRGRVVADTATNSLIITDTRSRVGQIAEFTRGLDLKTPQLSIQAKIIFVDRSDIEQLGVKYDLGSSSTFFNRIITRTDATTGEPDDARFRVDLGGNSVAAVANADNNIIQSALDLIFSTSIGGFDLSAFLQALETVQLSDIQAEPVISTLDNRPADILVGEEVPLRVVDYSSVGVAGAAPRATVQFRETGIRLTVTPHVTANRQILMNLRTERSAIQPLASADLGFIFNKQLATNQLLVNDGETAVIGGLTVTEVRKTRSGIPLLSGLPIIGKLFSYTSDEERRRDLIILVTPRIIDDGQPGN